ncbi:MULTISPECIES: hypothetical protein [unclassified Rhizobium]|uniref:hypothetical protein n=1 Tax=unclassified Rhizobium TaxID=2613769 RepID=UPI001ADB4AE9|nr:MULTISPECIES: hypothetical protein [unclassified Rhizobium]MBO9127754.1 hypothetical protein [Rhizobium sp. 16-488-2b]MBO9178216.1 hypothetical protein [Rhizobium sp. 16-488-2a]
MAGVRQKWTLHQAHEALSLAAMAKSSRDVMRRIMLSVIGMLVIFIALYWALSALTTSSSTVALPETDYTVTYQVRWGLGMDEGLIISQPTRLLSEHRPLRIKVEQKPYNTGMAVFRSSDGATYFFGFGVGFYRFVTTTNKLDYACSIGELVEHTPLGKQLFERGTTTKSRDVLDPDGRPIWGFLRASSEENLPRDAPASRYYSSLTFLGQFGLADGTRSDSPRGGKAVFASADDISEPRSSLDGNCKLSSMARSTSDW